MRQTHRSQNRPDPDRRRKRVPRPRRVPPLARLTSPSGAAGKGGVLDRPRTAAVPVVPAPADRGGDELRHPADRRGAGALDIRRPPPL